MNRIATHIKTISKPKSILILTKTPIPSEYHKLLKLIKNRKLDLFSEKENLIDNVNLYDGRMVDLIITLGGFNYLWKVTVH
jgi:hypothetical protein